MAFDTETQQRIVIAAATVAGPNANDADVKSHVSRIAGYLSEGSLPMGAFADLERRDASTVKVKGFPATIIGMDKELTSTRGVVLLRTAPSKWHPNGQEFSRTERTDTEAGRAMAQRLQSLVGHKVFLSVAVEGTGEANVRSVRSVDDKGIDPEYVAGDPAWTFDYTALEPKMIAKLATQQRASA